MDKQIYMSSTIRAIVTLGAIALGQLGVSISQDEQETLVETLISVATGILIIYAIVKGIIGRIKVGRDLKVGNKKL